jgi:hypothetical protein
MPMVAFAAFIIVPDLANARSSIEQRIFQPMHRWRNWRGNPPQHHLNDRTVIVVDPLMEQQPVRSYD